MKSLFAIWALLFSATAAFAAAGLEEKTQLAASLEPGVYRVKGHENEAPAVFLSVHNTGEIMGNDPSPFQWRQEGEKLIVEFLNLPKGEKRAISDVTGPTSFVWKDARYEKDEKIRAHEYDYAEQGASGRMTIFDSGDDAIEVKIETAADNGDTCEVFMEGCAEKGGKVICRPMDSDDPDIMLVISRKANVADVSGTLGESDYCGARGSFMGKYKTAGK